MKHFSFAIGLAVLVCTGGCSNSGNDPAVATDSELSANAASVIEQTITTLDGDSSFSNRFDHVLITESSGLQRSQQLDGVYFTHNDSGGDAVLFVTDAMGHDLGTVTLPGVAPVDWEAIAGVRLNGQASLVIADIGDNNQSRGDVNFVVVAEPDLQNLPFGFNISSDSHLISVSYSDGLSYDAEAVFVDGDNDTVVVFTKNFTDTTQQAMWKGSLATGLSDGQLVLEYRGLVLLSDDPRSNAITDIDIHPNGRELAMLTYGPFATGRIHIWQADAGEGTADALLRAADQIISVPLISANIQAEAVSYSPDGNYILVGAEAISSSTLTVIPRR